LIEAFTYRLGDHTTSDDARMYRDEKEVEEWKKKDPILRYKKYLERIKLWNEDKESKLLEEAKLLIEKAVEKAENFPKPLPEDIFKYTYAEMTPQLKEQLANLKESLE